MTLPFHGIGARLERGDQDSDSVKTLTRPNPYSTDVVALQVNVPQPPEYVAWRGNSLAAHHLSLAVLGLTKPAPSSSAPITSFFSPKRLSGPVQFVLKLLDYWRLGRDDAVSLLGFDSTDSDYVKDVLNGMASFRGRDVRDRIAHLFHIWTTLSSLFQDRDVENDWLREPHALLDEQSPLNLLLGGAMENLLLVKEYVDAAAGH